MKTFKSEEELMDVFDKGEESMTAYMDPSTLRKPGKEAQRAVNVVMSDTMISELDLAADRACVPRQALIKLWLRERLDDEADRQSLRAAVA